MTSAISPVQGSDSAGNAVEPVTETVLVTTHGTTSIADIVIAKIAGLATREIAGVYRVGGRGAAGTFGSIRQKIGNPDQPELRVEVTIEPGVDPARIRTRIADEALTHVRTALDSPRLPTQIVFAVARPKRSVRTYL